MSLAFGAAAGMRARARSFDGRSSLSVEDATRNLYLSGQYSPPMSPPLTSSEGSGDSIRSLELPREGHLYFPPRPLQPDEKQSSNEDEEYFISVRNLFAFLACQPLVGTARHSSIFSIFVLISGHLSRLGFMNMDGSTFGEAAQNSCGFFFEAFQLADVRKSREKTIEGLILGERMKDIELYNEAFAHAVGKYDELTSMKSALFPKISASTRNRIERSWIDLGQRKQAVSIELESFEFHALFSGMAASTTSDDSKIIRFKAWKNHFGRMRAHTLGYYKSLHGAWPPRASSKKNTFERDGLNRLVLRKLYLDLCTLYDLLVDRTLLTTRGQDASTLPQSTIDPVLEALRKLLDESDHSSPPVSPPIPFDVPLLPSISTIEPNIASQTEKLQASASSRRLKDYEMKLILARSHNLDSDLKTPFLSAYKAFEEKEAKGKSASELSELRIGTWLFLYAVLQSLPMLVVDAPNLKFAQGVETFLCQPPKGLPPWQDDQSAVKRNWYGVVGGAGMVSLPSDVVEYGTEGIHRASHCWKVADQWLHNLEFHDPEVEEHAMSPTEPSSDFLTHARHDSEFSLEQDQVRRNSNRLSIGLEQLAIPDGWSTVADPYADQPSRNPTGFDEYPLGALNHTNKSNVALATPTYHQGRSRGMSKSGSTMDLRSQAQHRPAVGRPRSTSNDGRMVGVGTGQIKDQIKEIKNFDDILADISKEKASGKGKKNKEKKDNGRKTFVLF